MPEEPSAVSILTSQLAATQEQISSLIAERDSLHTALSDIGAERDELRGRLESPDELTQRVYELEASIRDRNHFDKFAELAKGAKAKDKALKQLWRDAKDRGYMLEDDEIDEKALQSVVAQLKTEVDYAFEPELDSTSAAAREAARPTSRTKYGLELKGEEPAAGSGRQERNKGADGTIVTQEMRADPKFMLDPRNKEIIRD